MPSAAQIAGADMVADLLPAGCPRPDMTIASRAVGAGRGIAFTIGWPATHARRGGEYRATIVVPNAHGRLRDAAVERLRQLLGRHHQIIRMAAAYDEERLACDYDPDTDTMVDDDTVTAWRMHVPLVLRRALDEAGVDEAGRLDLLEREGSIEWRGCTISIDDAERETVPLLRGMEGIPEIALVTRWVRRATITNPKATWSQGISRSYLKVHMPMPETLLAAVVGRPPSDIVDLPGLDAPGLLVTSSKSTKSGCEFDIARSYSTLAAIPGEQA